MAYGLTIALIVGIPLGIAMARIRWLDWALDLPINALYATPLVAVVKFSCCGSGSISRRR